MQIMLNRILHILVKCVVTVLLCAVCFSSLAATSIWKIIGDSLNLKAYRHNYYVRTEIRWYLSHPEQLHETTENAKPYIYYVTQEIKKRGMPLELALLPMIESDYDPFSHSSANAVGLWQFMPGTARDLGVHINWWYDGRRDIVASTHAALDYLQYLHDYFHSWPLAFAAYNAGIGTVTKAICYNQSHHLSINYWALPLPKQTKAYVPKLLAIAIILSNPKAYHLPTEIVKNKPYFSRVQMSCLMSLKQIARLANTSPKIIHQLNPGFKRWKPAPTHHYSVLIPFSRLAQFQTKLNSYLRQINQEQVYTVQTGDSLSIIAQSHHVTLTALRESNHLDSDLIRTGQQIYIPTV